MFEDIHSEVLKTGSAMDSTTRANRVWESACYDLKLFTVEGRTLTKAEAFLAWAQEGYTPYQCRLRWGSGMPQIESGECRKLDPAWKRERARALMDPRGVPMRAQR